MAASSERSLTVECGAPSERISRYNLLDLMHASDRVTSEEFWKTRRLGRLLTSVLLVSFSHSLLNYLHVSSM